jgi:hypothetical protein
MWIWQISMDYTFAKPSGIYTKSSGIGVIAAINAPGHPYLDTNLCRGNILFLVLDQNTSSVITCIKIINLAITAPTALQ